MVIFIFQNFTTFNFIVKRVTGGLFDYYGVISKDEKQIKKI